MLELLEKHVFHKQAWEQLKKQGLPTKQSAAFRYVRLKELYAKKFHPVSKTEHPLFSNKNQLVFLDGEYAPHLSSPPKEVVALPLEKALKTYGGFLHPRLASQLKQESDPFALVNHALCSNALFIYLPPKSSNQFEIIHLTSAQSSPFITTPRIHLYAGKEAQATCFIHYKAALQDSWNNSLFDIALDEQASLNITSLLEESQSSWHFDATRATLKQGSQLKSYAVTNGGATSRQDYKIQLLEKDAEASLYGVCQIDQKRHHHTHILIEHLAPHTRSLQHFKNVLKGNSRTSFEGKIYVHREAQKTDAYQMNHNLILSKHAQANSKPNLEIFADDVKATHGSTVGQIDLNHLLYLKTRGIPHALAKKLLVEGFCLDILDQIEQPYADVCRLS